MWNTALTKQLLIIVNIVIVLLVSSSSIAYSKRIHAWEDPGLTIYANRVCKDGMRLGVYEPFSPQVLTFKFFKDFQIEDDFDIPETAIQIGILENVIVDPSPYGPWCNYDKDLISDIKTHQSEGNSPLYCGGTFRVDWNSSIVDVGDIIAVAPFNSEDQLQDFVMPLHEFPISDCSVDDMHVQLQQTHFNTSETFISDALVFQVTSYDPNWGYEDGAGIINVNFSILDPTGKIVHKRTESKAAYCAFGNPGDGDCSVWQFSEHSYKWPNGTLIQEGEYILRTVVQRYEGENIIKEWPIQIQFPQAATNTPTGTSTSTQTPTPTGTSTSTQTPTPTITITPRLTPVPTSIDEAKSSNYLPIIRH